MKKIILNFMLLAFVSTPFFSQELWLNEIDDFTGESNKATKAEIIGDNQEEKKYLRISIKLSTMRMGDTWAFRLKATSDLGCAGASGNYVMLKFSDDKVIKLEDVADIDCSDMSESLFLVNEDLMARINAKDAPVMIRFKQADYYTDAKLVDAEKWSAHFDAVAP